MYIILYRVINCDQTLYVFSPHSVLDICIDFVPPSYEEFMKSIQKQSKGLPFPRTKYDELISNVQVSLIGDRAEVLAIEAKKQKMSPEEFDISKLKRIADKLGKAFWVDDEKTIHPMCDRIRMILEKSGKNKKSRKKRT